MEIGFNSINSIDSKKFKINNTNKVAKTESYNFQGKDELQISSTAKDYGVAMKNLKNVPDVREDVVASYKEKISQGNYTISSDAIAEKLVNDWLG